MLCHIVVILAIILLSLQCVLCRYPSGLDVGTYDSEGANDVVADGYPTLAWSPFTFDQLVGADTLSTTFYISMTSGYSPKTFTTPVVQVSPSNSLLTFLDGIGAGGGIAASDKVLTIVVVYVCLFQGTAVVNLTLTFDETAEAVTWTWNKQCSGYITGLDIGTQPGLSDVVDNGQSTPAFSPAMHTYVVADDTLTTSLFLFLDPTVSNLTQGANFSWSLSPPLVTATPSSVCNATATLSGSEVSGSQSATVGVEYRCGQAGACTVSVTLAADDPRLTPAVVAWYKLCPDYLPGLQLGTQPAGDDVATDGQPTALWSPAVAGFVVVVDEQYLPLYVSMADGYGVATVGPATVQCANASVCTAAVTGALTGAVEVGRNGSVVLGIDHVCIGEGPSVVTASLAVEPLLLLPPLEVGWTKLCGPYRLGLMVGTAPGGDDVVANGQPTPAYLPLAPAVMLSDLTAASTFYLSLVDGAGEQPYGPPQVVVSDAAALAVTVSGSASEGGSLNATGPSASITIGYTCLRQASARVAVTVPLGPQLQPAVFGYGKLCSGLPVALDVSLPPAVANVVANGTATPAFSPGTHDYFVPSDTLATTLQFAAAANYTLGKPQVTANPPNCDLVSTGTAAAGGWLEAGPLSLTVTYNCLYPGEVEVALNLSTSVVVAGTAYPLSPVVVVWAKLSGGNRNGFEVGSAADVAADVVANGMALPAWLPAQPAMVLTDQPTTAFFIRMADGAPTQPFGPPSVSATPQGRCAPLLAGPAAFGGVANSTAAMPLVVTYGCFAPATLELVVTLPLAAPWNPVQFGWTLVTSGDCMDFAVATTPGLSDVVDGGAPTLAWAPATHNQLVGGSVQSSVFYAQLVYYYGSDHTNQTVVSTVSSSSPATCAPVLSGELAESQQATDVPQSLVVDYNCQQAGAVVVTVTMQLPPFNPVSFAWTKLAGGVRQGVNVGTVPDGQDIVSNGITLAPWAPLRSEITVSGEAVATTFFISMTAGTGTQPFQPILATSSTGVCNLTLAGSAAAGGVASESPVPFCVFYSCEAPQPEYIKVTLEMPPYNTIQWAWTKMTLQNRLGFSVGTALNISDVVANGTATAEYSAGAPPKVLNGVGRDIPAVFYLWMSEPYQLQRFESPLASVVRGPGCSKNITIHGNASTGGLLSSSAVYVLEIALACTPPSSSELEVVIPLPGGFNNVVFAFSVEGARLEHSHRSVMPDWEIAVITVGGGVFGISVGIIAWQVLRKRCRHGGESQYYTPIQ